MIWKMLYNVVVVPAMECGLLLAGIASPKVQRGIKGRLGEGDRLRLAKSRCRARSKRVVVHCASAGELESAIPLIEELQQQYNADVILTYFSPSAVNRANTVGGIVDHLYLPVDSKRRMRRLLDILSPDLVVFVKHDVWPNLVWEAAKRNIPTALVNGNFRPDSKRLKRPLIPFGRGLFGELSAIFAVASDDAHRFRFLAGKKPVVEAEGDTRFDRVRQRALKGREDQGALARILEGRPVAVAGSTWPAGEKILLEAWKGVRAERSDAVLVLTPHEPTEEHLKQLIAQCEEAGLMPVTMTEAENNVPVSDVIIVDRMGVLAGLYGLGKVAYVGGGFGAGVHSVIEPAVFGMPVMFGPKHLNSHEARDLIRIQAGQSVESAEEIRDRFINALNDGLKSREMANKAHGFVEKQSGVARRLAAKLATLAGCGS